MNIFLKRAAITLAVLVICEQSFLKFYLDKAVLHRDAEFREFIERVRKSPGGFAAIDYKVCETKYIDSLPYQYQMCISTGFKDIYTSEALYGFSVTTPAGFLSLIPSDYGDRRIIFGVLLFELRSDGKIAYEMAVHK